MLSIFLESECVKETGFTDSQVSKLIGLIIKSNCYSLDNIPATLAVMVNIGLSYADVLKIVESNTKSLVNI